MTDKKKKRTKEEILKVRQASMAKAREARKNKTYKKEVRRSLARNRISIEKWKMMLSSFIENNGSAKAAYDSLPKGTCSWDSMLKYTHSGDPDRSLEPFHDIYRESVSDAIGQLKLDLTDRLKMTLELGSAYKIALAKKIQLLDRSPEKVSDRIGSELLALSKIEQTFIKMLNEEDPKKTRLHEKPLEEALRMAGEARSALARHMENLEEKDSPDSPDSPEPENKVSYKFEQPTGGYQKNVIQLNAKNSE